MSHMLLIILAVITSVFMVNAMEAMQAPYGHPHRPMDAPSEGPNPSKSPIKVSAIPRIMSKRSTTNTLTGNIYPMDVPLTNQDSKFNLLTGNIYPMDVPYAIPDSKLSTTNSLTGNFYPLDVPLTIQDSKWSTSNTLTENINAAVDFPHTIPDSKLSTTSSLTENIYHMDVSHTIPDSKWSSTSLLTGKIYLDSSKLSISDIDNSSLPWLIPALKPDIFKFSNDVLRALKSSPVVQEIWAIEFDSDDVRNMFFKIGVSKFPDHPYIPALYNFLSKIASLFPALSNDIYFQSVAISLAEFLLTEKIQPSRNYALQYVRFIVKELESADRSDIESIFHAYLNGYVDFFAWYGYDLNSVIDKAFALFTSQLVVFYQHSSV